MPPDERRRLVLDEDMNWKLQRELLRRGLAATSVRDLGLANRGTKDHALLLALTEHEPIVLIAWDNKMPLVHRYHLDLYGTTLAIIDRQADRGGLNDEQYYRDVIHRQAHRIATQTAGTVLKYSRTRRATVYRDRPS